jgi:hypothetical protein
LAVGIAGKLIKTRNYHILTCFLLLLRAVSTPGRTWADTSSPGTVDTSVDTFVSAASADLFFAIASNSLLALTFSFDLFF